MEITKKGVLPRGERLYELECHWCNTAFSSRLGEGRITYEQEGGSCESTSTYVTFNCPLCGREIYSDLTMS